MLSLEGFLTKVGQAKVAQSKALGQNIYLWQMTVSSRTPDGMQEHYRATIHQLKLKKGRVTARFVLPSGVGDWNIDQVGLLNRDGDLLALQSLPFLGKEEGIGSLLGGK
ncbi:MAG: phage tail protein [Limnochordia bacterium]|nr:phage tail protein [Limnochordia bacterium]